MRTALNALLKNLDCPPHFSPLLSEDRGVMGRALGLGTEAPFSLPLTVGPIPGLEPQCSPLSNGYNNEAYLPQGSCAEPWTGGCSLRPLSPWSHPCWPHLSSVGTTVKGRRGEEAVSQASTPPMPCVQSPVVPQQRRRAQASRCPNIPASIPGGAQPGGLPETQSPIGPLFFSPLIRGFLPPHLPLHSGPPQPWAERHPVRPCCGCRASPVDGR